MSLRFVKFIRIKQLRSHPQKLWHFERKVFLMSFIFFQERWHLAPTPEFSAAVLFRIAPVFSMNSLSFFPIIVFHTGNLKVTHICMQQQQGQLNVRDGSGGRNKDGESEDDRNAFPATNANHSKCQGSHSLLHLLPYLFHFLPQTCLCLSDKMKCVSGGLMRAFSI